MTWNTFQGKPFTKEKLDAEISKGIKSIEEALPNAGVHPPKIDGESLTAGVTSFNINIQHLVELFNRNESVG
jgi:hypothetical protein